LQVEPGSGPTDGSASEPTNTNLTVRLRPDGDAEWTVRVGVALSGPNATRAFRRLGTRYEAGRADAGPSIVPFERAIAAANRRTDREMAIADVSRSARIENGTGYLTLRFVWSEFAADGSSRIRVGDAFRTPRGTWLPGLAADQTLTLVPPRGYGVNSAPIGPENGTLRWEGPIEFEPGYLTVTYRRGLQATTTIRTTAAPPDESGTPLLPVAAVAAFGVGLLVVFYVRSRGFSLPGDGGGATGPAETEGGERIDTEPGGSPAGANAGIDEELLSDEERVERLLEANGGRMRQAAIVTETRWSNAKVSQLLSAMDRENRVDKLRIGRENLISLPDEDVGDLEDE
jgi:hypothetical protein